MEGVRSFVCVRGLGYGVLFGGLCEGVIVRVGLDSGCVFARVACGRGRVLLDGFIYGFVDLLCSRNKK